MTDLDFLDEAGTATPESAQTPATQDNTNTDATGPDTAVSAPGADAADKPKYTKVTATYPEGTEVPDGFKTISDFAGELSVRNVLAAQAAGGAASAADLVDKSAIYAATRAVRNPLPVIVIGETAYLGPDAVTAWDNRPVRGEGGTSSGAGGTLTDEELFKAANAARDSRVKLEKRLASIRDERLPKAQKLEAKRDNQLKVRNLTWEQVEEWASAQEVTEPDNEDKSE